MFPVVVKPPVTVAPALVVSNFLTLLNLNSQAPSWTNTAEVSVPAAFLILNEFESNLNSPVPASTILELDPSW